MRVCSWPRSRCRRNRASEKVHASVAPRFVAKRETTLHTAANCRKPRLRLGGIYVAAHEGFRANGRAASRAFSSVESRRYFTGTSLFSARRFPNGSRKNASQTLQRFQFLAMTWASLSTLTPLDFSIANFCSSKPCWPATRK
jgi:hypothetical protein